LPGEPEAGQERAGLGEAAAAAGELVDAVDGLGGGAGRPRVEGRFDGVGLGGQFGGRAGRRFPPGEGVPSAIPVRDQGPLGGGDADGGEVGRLLAGVAEVDGLQDVQLAADDRIGVGVAVGQNAGRLVGGSGGAELSGHPRLPVGPARHPLAVDPK